MDVTDLVRRLARRWLAVLAALILAVLAAGAAGLSAGTTQQSTATVLIVPPVLGEGVPDRNPLLNLDFDLTQLSTTLASAMGSQQSVAALTPQTGTATWTISTVTGTNPSFAQLSAQLVFTVTASSPAVAVQTTTALIEVAGQRLEDLQTQVGAPFASRARLVTVVSPTAAVAAGSGRLRAAGTVGLGVGALGLLGVLLLDELLTRRSARRSR